MPYKPSEYWSHLHDRQDLSAVGQSTLSSAMNRELYRILARNLRRFLRRHGNDSIKGDAFEVGAGTGYWIDFWRGLGAERVDGCDLVPAAVQDLNARFGSGGKFRAADIGSEANLDFGTYDFVACMNVLLHLTDDTKFDLALRNVARLVRRGGRLLLTEPILMDASFERAYDPEVASRARPLRRYREGLEREGLELSVIEGATAVGNNPIESRWHWMLRLWGRTWTTATWPQRIDPSNARWVGPILYRLDPILMAMGAAPSSKFALFVRPNQAPGQQASS
jgi:SAM-dependent methyltransferase